MYVHEDLNVGGPAFFNNNVLNVGTNLKTFLADYRRPVLKYVSATTVDVENNTGTANETKLVFPDGEVRRVAENTGSTNQYRRFDITATANFASGTEDSGLRSGLSEANNTRYAVYGVKSLINTANFVLAGDTTFPTQANVATLNDRYGENSWLFLNYVWNGDDGGAAADIVSFFQVGNKTYFTNTNTGGNVGAINAPGILLATVAATATLTYTYAAGSATKQIPNTIVGGIFVPTVDPIASYVTVHNSGATRVYAQDHPNAQVSLRRIDMNVNEGVRISNGAASNLDMDIFLAGYVDGVLGVGANPFI